MSRFLSVAQSTWWRWAARAGEVLLGGAIIYAALASNWGAVIGLGCFLAMSVAYMQMKEPLPPLFDFLFIAAALMNAGGFAWHWYKVLGPYDALAHGFTIFAITLSLGFLLYRARLEAFIEQRWLLMVTIGSFGIALGAVWEIIEWSIDYICSTALAPSLTDTVTDMMMNVLGSTGAAALTNWGLPDRVQALRARRGQDE